MKLNTKAKKILKIATVSALAFLEIYLIYAAAASMYTYNQHPPFIAEDGEIAQSTGYRVQSYLCIAFAVIMPFVSGALSYFIFFKKPRVAPAAKVENMALEAAATAETIGDDLDAIDVNDIASDSDEASYPKPL